MRVAVCFISYFETRITSISHMKNIICAILTIAVISFFVQSELSAQNTRLRTENVKWPVDSLGNKGRNVIKWNLTPLLLWDSKNINLSYERILRSHRSISVNAGFFRFPKLVDINEDSVSITRDSKRNGFSVSFDYRRYFANRNLRWAPDGLYWGFWTSYHLSRFENELNALNDKGSFINAKSKGKISIFAIGAELGYQFLIGEHFVVDLIMIGPAIARYSFNVDVSADGDLMDGEIAKEIIVALIEKIPGLGKLIDEGNISDSGGAVTSTLGLRFMVQIGYRF
jgi:hypothetical protein